MHTTCSSILKNKTTCLLLAVEIIAWATFAARQLARLLSRNRAGHPRVFMAILALGLLLGAAAVFSLARAANRSASRYSVSVEFIFRKWSLALTPAFLLFLDFLPKGIMLRDPSARLCFLAAAGSIYLLAVVCHRLFRKRSPTGWFPEYKANAGSQPRRRMMLQIFLASFVVYSLLLLNGMLPSMPFSGDEPHYLLIAKSIVRDGDINLYNNYRQKEYWEFYPGELSWHAYPGKKGLTHLYSKHFPALPLLLAPAYWCGDLLEKIVPSLEAHSPNGRSIKILLARETMVLFTALLAVVFFLLAWEFSGSRRLAIYSWLFFAFSLPTLAYSQLLYSEIPVALILLLVLRQAVYKKPDSRKSLFWTGIGIALLPWFGIKYFIPAAASLIAVMAANWKSLQKKKPDIFFLFGPLFVSGALLFTFLLQIYGTISPIAVYHGAFKAKVIPVINSIRFRPKEFFLTAVAYFLDQRIGLFIYSPLYILFIPGIVFWIRRFKKKAAAFLFVAAATLVFFTLGNFRGGHNPPGRSLLPIVPILALFAAGTLAWAKNRVARHVSRILAILGMVMVLMALWQPRMLFHEGLSSDSWNQDTQAYLLTHFSNAGIDFSRWVPNLIYRPDFSWIVLCLWLLAVIIISLAVLNKKPVARPDRPAGSIAGHMVCVFALSGLFSIHQAFNVKLDLRNSLAGRGYTVYFQDDNVFGSELGGFWTRGNCRVEVAVHAAAPLKWLRLELSSQVPIKALLHVGSLAIPVRASTSTYGRFNTTRIISPGRGKPWNDGYLYLISFQVTNGFVPARMDHKSADQRCLGLFVRLAAE